MLPSLNDILTAKTAEVETLVLKLRQAGSTTVMRALSDTRSLLDVLSAEAFAVIPEMKRSDPWHGSLRESFVATEFARQLAEAGAPAIAIQTDKSYFGGRYEDLFHAAHEVSVPVLQRDFVIDRAQMTHAKAMGADATKLTIGLCSTEALRELREFGSLIMIEAIFEVRSVAQLDDALALEPEVLGVPARDEQSGDIEFSGLQELRARVPETIPMYVAGGVRDADDVKRVRDAGFAAVIVGAAIMQATDIVSGYAALRDA